MSVGAIVVTLAFFSVIIGELAPKRIAMAAPETIASRLARPIEWLSQITQPVVHLLGDGLGEKPKTEYETEYDYDFGLFAVLCG